MLNYYTKNGISHFREANDYSERISTEIANGGWVSRYINDELKSLYSLHYDGTEILFGYDDCIVVIETYHSVYYDGELHGKHSEKMTWYYDPNGKYSSFIDDFNEEYTTFVLEVWEEFKKQAFD